MPATPSFRTDRHNNPTAFTTDIAKEAGLILGTDYTQGEPFNVEGHTYYTAKLLGDPIATTLHVINKIGFYSKWGSQRWVYIGMPDWIWQSLDVLQRKRVIGFMYQHEGGTQLKGLFA